MPAPATIAGSTTSSNKRRRAISRLFSDFAVSRALPDGPAGNLSTGSAITPLLFLLVLVGAVGLRCRADVVLDGVELLDQALGVGRLQMDKRLLVDLVADLSQRRNQRA